jgi:hypothetical protein
MKKAFVVCVMIFLALYSWCDLKVDQGEISKGREINFVGYSGPYLYYYTLEEIRDIGVRLGSNIAGTYSRSTFNGLYSMIHAYDPADSSGKLDADIFVIEPGAFLDNVRNLRIILAGFLEKAYGYSYDDALTIAKFVTYYNATFRGDMAYFRERYKELVLKHISASDAGLAVAYNEWPGKTKAVIPLNDEIQKGNGGTPDTTELTGEKVIEDLKKREDKGVEDRKDMVEIQEKELEKAEKDLAQDKAKLEEDKKKLEEDKRQLEQDKKNGTLTDSQITEKEAEIKNREDKIKKQEEEITAREEEIKKKQETVKKTREDIVTDERSLPAENKNLERETGTTAVPDAATGKALFLQLPSGAEDTRGELVLLDFANDSVLARSEHLNIKERRYYVLANSVLVVAEPDADGRTYLVQLDPVSLKPTAKSGEQVFGRTIVIINANNIYAVVRMGNSYYVGRFDRNLKLLNASQEEVNPLTPLILSGTALYAQAKGGRVLLLSPSDLALRKTAALP